MSNFSFTGQIARDSPPTQQNNILAVKIVSWQFGDFARDIFELAVTKQQVTFKQICRQTKIKPSIVIKTLRRLVYQNVISVSSGLDEKMSCYSANVEDVLWRIRYPRFLAIAKAETGYPAAHAVLEAIMENGNLTFEQIVSLVSLKYREWKMIFDENRVKPEEERVQMEEIAPLERSEIEEALNHFLVPRHFVRERKVEERTTMLQRAVGPGHVTVIDMPKAAGSAKTGKRKKTETPVDDFMRPHKLQTTLETASVAAINSSTFSVDTDGFSWHLRTEVFVNFIISKYGEDAGAVVARIMELALEGYVWRKPDELARLIFSINSRALDIPELPSRRAVAAMNLMTENSNIFNGSETTGFFIDFGNLIRAVQVHHMQAIFQTRFGTLGPSFLNVFLDKKHVEVSSFWDFCLSWTADSQKVLYEMARHGYIESKEITKTLEITSLKKHFLWTLDYRKVIDLLRMEMYKTQFNYLMRIGKEKKNIQKVIGSGAERADLNGQQRTHVEKFERRVRLLQSNILRLEHQYFIFEI